MKILTTLDFQIINYFYSQFRHIGSLFYLSPMEGAIIYIGIIGYIISSTIPNKTQINKSKRTKI